MVVKQNVLTPELFLELYTSVGWEPPGIDQVGTALEHTMATFTVHFGISASIDRNLQSGEGGRNAVGV